MSDIDISVITPSYNSLSFLKRCCRSVADQEGVVFEHIVADGLSADGTPEWLRAQKNITSIIEKDRGPHDAEHKGFLRARGDILCYINCDEQYLPGTLLYARRYFDEHPDVDILFGDFLSVRPDGTLIAYRKGYHPRWCYIMASHLYVFTCGMFFRRRIYDEGVHFNPDKPFSGDQDWVIRALRAGYRARHVNRYMATYVRHTQNMSTTADAEREKRDTLMAGPRWVRTFRRPLDVIRLAEKLLSGAYHEKMPLSYSIYAADDAGQRTVFTVNRASWWWR